MKRTQTFPMDPLSVGAARRFANAELSDSPPDVRQSVELMVSELITNCVRHVQTSCELTIERSADEIRVEVTDHGGGTPAIRSPGPEEPNGRGLRIVEMLSARWGVEQRAASGKTVWFTVATTASVPAGRETSRHASSASPQQGGKRLEERSRLMRVRSARGGGSPGRRCALRSRGARAAGPGARTARR